MKLITEVGREDLAKVYIAETVSGRHIEFAESLQPPFTIDEKWVLTISTLHGCPVGCSFCDAGGWFDGKLTKDEILDQVDLLVENRFHSRIVPVEKFKIQFARVGEPSLNPAVLDALRELPSRYQTNGIYASISTIAPIGRDTFFDELIEIKNEYYRDGHFQLQFSIHTSDQSLRDEIIPVKKWDFDQIADYSRRFYNPESDRKVVLNFALESSYPLDGNSLLEHFDPELFFIKITPVNPTFKAEQNNLESYLDSREPGEINSLVTHLETCGYDVLISIGEREENLIGSNCGQYLQKMFAVARASERS